MRKFAPERSGKRRMMREGASPHWASRPVFTIYYWKGRGLTDTPVFTWFLVKRNGQNCTHPFTWGLMETRSAALRALTI